jgi:hypothetical protein
MNITETLKEAIEKNLPTMVGKELQQYIAEAEAIKEDLAKKEAVLLTKDERINKLVAENERLIKLELSAEDMANREDVLQEKQRHLAVDIAHEKQKNAEKLAEQAFNMVSLVFRNPTVMRSQNTTYPVPVSTGMNSPSYVQAYTQNETIHEETK